MSAWVQRMNVSYLPPASIFTIVGSHFKSQVEVLGSNDLLWYQSIPLVGHRLGDTRSACSWTWWSERGIMSPVTEKSSSSRVSSLMTSQQHTHEHLIDRCRTPRLKDDTISSVCCRCRGLMEGTTIFLLRGLWRRLVVGGQFVSYTSSLTLTYM